MHFLPDMYVACEECKGKRYNKATLEVTYKDKSISDVLDMYVEDAHRFFKIFQKSNVFLKTLVDVGLGYMKLGQPSTSLSGGEAQRIKLATELSKQATGKTLYILDEPTTGLHFADIQQLLKNFTPISRSGQYRIGHRTQPGGGQNGRLHHRLRP